MQLISLCLVFGHQKMICYCGFHVHIESNATNHQPTVNSFINQYTVLHLEAQRQITQRILRLCWRFIFKLILMTSAWRVIHPSASALYNYLRYCVANLLEFYMYLSLQCVDCLLLWCGTRHPYVILDYQSFHMSLFIHHSGLCVRTYKRSETLFAILSPKSQWHKVTFLGIYNEQEVMSGDNIVDRFWYFLFIYIIGIFVPYPCTSSCWVVKCIWAYEK